MIFQKIRNSFSIGIVVALLADFGCNGRITQAADLAHVVEPVPEAGLSDISSLDVGVLHDAAAKLPETAIPDPPQHDEMYCPPTVATCDNWCNGTPRIDQGTKCHYGYICMNGQDPCTTKPCPETPCKADFVCDENGLGLCNWKPVCIGTDGKGWRSCDLAKLCPSGTYVQRCDWNGGVSLCECEVNGVVTKKFQQPIDVHDCNIGCDFPKK